MGIVKDLLNQGKTWADLTPGEKEQVKAKIMEGGNFSEADKPVVIWLCDHIHTFEGQSFGDIAVAMEKAGLDKNSIRKVLTGFFLFSASRQIMDELENEDDKPIGVSVKGDGEELIRPIFGEILKA